MTWPPPPPPPELSCRRPQLEALHVLEMDRQRRAEFVLKNPRILQVSASKPRASTSPSAVVRAVLATH